MSSPNEEIIFFWFPSNWKVKSLVAPLTIEKDSVVGAGSVITKNVNKKSLALTRSPQIEIKNYKRKR